MKVSDPKTIAVHGMVHIVKYLCGYFRPPLQKSWFSLADGKLKIKSKIKFFRAQASKNHKNVKLNFGLNFHSINIILKILKITKLLQSKF